MTVEFFKIGILIDIQMAKNLRFVKKISNSIYVLKIA